MTDKVIIHGVDISKCPSYMSSLGRYNCIALGHNGGATCEKSPNCYYKQLKRKEQALDEIEKAVKQTCKQRCANECLGTRKHCGYGNILTIINKTKEQ